MPAPPYFLRRRNAFFACPAAPLQAVAGAADFDDADQDVITAGPFSAVPHGEQSDSYLLEVALLPQKWNPLRQLLYGWRKDPCEFAAAPTVRDERRRGATRATE